MLARSPYFCAIPIILAAQTRGNVRLFAVLSDVGTDCNLLPEREIEMSLRARSAVSPTRTAPNSGQLQQLQQPQHHGTACFLCPFAAAALQHEPEAWLSW